MNRRSATQILAGVLASSVANRSHGASQVEPPCVMPNPRRYEVEIKVERRSDGSLYVNVPEVGMKWCQYGLVFKIKNHVNSKSNLTLWWPDPEPITRVVARERVFDGINEQGEACKNAATRRSCVEGEIQSRRRWKLDVLFSSYPVEIDLNQGGPLVLGAGDSSGDFSFRRDSGLLPWQGSGKIPPAYIDNHRRYFQFGHLPGDETREFGLTHVDFHVEC